MTTKEKIEDYLLVDIDDSLNEQIIFYINAVTKWIERKTGRVFEAQEYEEIYKGSGTHYLNLNNYPVSKVDSVYRNDGIVGDPIWTLIEDNYYYVKEEAGQIYYTGGFFKQEAEYKVKYTAGYDEGSEEDNIPDDLSLVATILVAELFKVQSGSARGIKSENLQELSVSFDDIDLGANKKLVDEILNSYRTPKI